MDRGLDEPDRREHAGEGQGDDREDPGHPGRKWGPPDSGQEDGERQEKEGKHVGAHLLAQGPEDREAGQPDERRARDRDRARQRRQGNTLQRAPNQREHGGAEDRVQRQQAPQLTGLSEADEEPVVRVELERDSKRGGHEHGRRDHGRVADEDRGAGTQGCKADEPQPEQDGSNVQRDGEQQSLGDDKCRDPTEEGASSAGDADEHGSGRAEERADLSCAEPQPCAVISARNISWTAVPSRSVSGAAVAADPGHLEPVAGRDEVVRHGDPVEPGVELAVLEFDDTVTTRAHQMVVVAVPAEAVAELALAVREGVDHPLLGEESERAVDGREAEPLAAGGGARGAPEPSRRRAPPSSSDKDRQALPRRARRRRPRASRRRVLARSLACGYASTE